MDTQLKVAPFRQENQNDHYSQSSQDEEKVEQKRWQVQFEVIKNPSDCFFEFFNRLESL